MLFCCAARRMRMQTLKHHTLPKLRCACRRHAGQHARVVRKNLRLVPVTYFRAVELPFMWCLGIDHGQFSINIQPDDYDTTQARRAAPC